MSSASELCRILTNANMTMYQTGSSEPLQPQPLQPSLTTVSLPATGDLLQLSDLSTCSSSILGENTVLYLFCILLNVLLYNKDISLNILKNDALHQI